MGETLEVGRSHHIERTVTQQLTADLFGNPGALVFATPALIALIEETAIGCISPTLDDGQSSVGTRIDIQHLAATPVGMGVRATVRVTEIDRRKVTFEVEAWDDVELIARGTHDRFIIESMQDFVDRASQKAEARGENG